MIWALACAKVKKNKKGVGNRWHTENWAAIPAVSKHAAKLITLAKRGDLHARRLVMAELVDEEATRKLFSEIAPKYADRQGGFTRIYKVGPRRGDAAEMAIIELI